jgi:branched-chain amino acid transport system ATP-binding protein
MSNPPVLSVSGISASYGAIKALREVTFEVLEKEILSIIGANGAGKTTLLLTLAGIIPIQSGAMTFEGRSASKLSPSERVAAGIALVPEGRKIFPKLTVLENLDMGAYLRSDAAQVKEDIARVYSLFPILFERRKQWGGTLSGGEQQMLAIGRALMSSPKLLLMDEPSMGVAPLLTERIFGKIEELNKEGLTIILVEQNAHRALDIANRACVLEMGTITLRGSAKELKDDANVQSAYLGA